MLQNSGPETAETFAVCFCKLRAKQMNQVTTQVFFWKLRLWWSKKDPSAQTGAVTLILHQLSLCVRSLSFQHQITTPSVHWKTWLLHIVPNQLVHGQDSSCPPVLSDTQPYWPRKHEVQGTFKAKSLHEPTTWTFYPCDIEIFRQDDENLNLVSSCVGHAETALVSSTCRVTAQSFQPVTCRHLKQGFV